MNKYIVERDMPNIGDAHPEALREAALKVSAALAELGPGVMWLHSYVTPHKTVCVYAAQNPDVIRKHAELAGLPVTTISEVGSVIDITSAG